MKITIISGNPKNTGLCRSVTDATIRGAADGGAEVEEINVSDLSYCHVCGDGWGICASEHRCTFGDDGFTKAQESARNADAIVLITPVYWGETSESLKSFLDRFRRCEQSAFGDRKGAIAGKPVLLVASPGGGGRGGLTTLEQMERFCDHTGAVVFDRIITTRWNSDYKIAAAYAATKAIAGGRRVGDTIPLDLSPKHS